MRLQSLIVERINEYGGIEELTKNLKRLRSTSSEKKWLDNMIIAFNRLYTQDVDLESHTLEYYQASIDTIEYLNKIGKRRKDATISFLIDLISFKLNHINGIKRFS